MSIFLEKELYLELASRVDTGQNLTEKGLQMIFCEILVQNFMFNRVYNEAPYRFYLKSPLKYYSDSEKHLCKAILKKQGAKKCDIRILSPSIWIELKYNKPSDDKDLEKLFGNDGFLFDAEEERYAISIYTKNSRVSPRKYMTGDMSKLELSTVTAGNIMAHIIHKN